MVAFEKWFNNHWLTALMGVGVLITSLVMVDCAGGTSYQEDAKAVGQIFVPFHNECRTATDSKGNSKVECDSYPAHWRITVEMPDGKLKDIKSQHGVPPGRQVVITYREGKYSHFRYGEAVE